MKYKIFSRNLFVTFLLTVLMISIYALINLKTKSYYEIIPVQFTKSKLPYVNVCIGSIDYPLVIDLGSRLEIEIESSLIKNISKHKIGTEKWKNFRGKEFQYPKYKLAKVKVGSLDFQNVILTEFPTEERKEYTVIGSNEKKERIYKTVGHLGRNLLKKTNLLFDMKNSKMIATNNLEKLKEEGYYLDMFTKVPFKLLPKGIQLNVETDLGQLKLMLDTGATWTFLHEFLYPDTIEKRIDSHGIAYFTTNLFSLEGKNFKSMDLHFLKMTEELHDIDGSLGMDFIQDHVMYIDFSKSLIYIQ